MIITAHFDAGCRGGSGVGPTACGAIIDVNGRKISQTKFLGESTVNVGEWSGLVLALEMIFEGDLYSAGDEIQIYSDSRLVVMQALGKWRVKNSRLIPYRTEAHRLASTIRSRGCSVMISHIPREHNGVADSIVREVLDRHMKELRRS